METNVDARPDFQRRPSGLLRGEEGQITVIFALLSMALVFFWMSVYQTGEVVSDRIKVQDTADACSYSGAVWGARMLNVICYTNRAIVANYVTMAEIVIARSNSKFWLDVAVIIELIANLLSWIPILGPILKVVATIIVVICTLYESLTWALSIALVRGILFMMEKGPVKSEAELWFVFVHNLCGLENTVHWLLVPPPILGFFADASAVSEGADPFNYLLPMTIKKTSEMIDPPPPEGTGGEEADRINEGRIHVNPSATSGVPIPVSAAAFIFRQATYQSFHDLLAWPAGKHGNENGQHSGEYEPGEREDGTKSAYNKMIDQKWRLKWLIEKTAERRLTGLWGWKRGAADSKGMGALSKITNLGFVGMSIGGETNVDEFYGGPFQEIGFMGGTIFVRIGFPEQMQNDKDIVAEDYLEVWYRQFWKLFSFPTKTLFRAGERAKLSEDTPPAFGTISPTVGTYYSDRNDSIDQYPETGYVGLVHEDNHNHELSIFELGGVVPNPLDHFPTTGVDWFNSSSDKVVWRPTGIHELDNHVYMQGNAKGRAVWKKPSGPPGYRGLTWMATELPTYCYVLDAWSETRAHNLTIPKEEKRNEDGEQLGKRTGVVATVAYKSAKGLKIVEVMGQGMDDAPEDDVMYKRQTRTEANMDEAETLTSHPPESEWEEQQVNLDMIRTGKFNGIGMGGLTAFAAAETFYENPGDPEEPPSDINPCWRARLTPVDRAFAAMLEGGPNGVQQVVMTPIRLTVDAQIALMRPVWRLLGGEREDIDLTTMMTH